MRQRSSDIEVRWERLKERGETFISVLSGDIRYLSSPSIPEPPLSALIISKEGVVGFAPKMEEARALELSDVEEVRTFSQLLPSYSKDLKSGLRKYLRSIGKEIVESDAKLDLRPIKVRKKNVVGELRRVKSPDELTKIKRSMAIAGKVSDLLWDLSSKCETELALAMEMNYELLRRGAQDLAFKTIVASGSNSKYPHHSPTSDRLNGAVVCDFGAIYEGYCSDLTRTFFIGSEKERVRFDEIYDIVKESQTSASNEIKEGVKGKKIDSTARRVIEKAGYGDWFLHSTGHGLGLEVHEKPSISPKSADQLMKGDVITVEPGIYLDFGIRIEDDFMV